MSKTFKPLMFDKCNVGKHIKSTKKRYLWKFELDKKEYEIILYISKLSGKRKILLNGDIHSEEKRPSSTFGSYPIRIGTHSLLVFEIDDNKFDLRVDNLSFEASYNSLKMNAGFNYEIAEKKPDDEEAFKPPARVIRRESPEAHRKSPEPQIRKAAKTVVKTAKEHEREEVRPKIEPKVKQPEPAPLDLFDIAMSTPGKHTLPDDLFSVPLNSSEPQTFNPFEEPKASQVSENPTEETRKPAPPDLFDLDNLHMGDNYSPAVAKKIHELNKPVSIGENAPNVPMHQLQNQNGGPGNMTGMMNGIPMMSGMMPGMMPGMMMSPMMAYNPFMTGMMQNSWMQNPK